MDKDGYQIVFSGKILPGHDADAAKRNMATLYKTGVGSIERLFNGAPHILKKDLDRASALKYQNALRKAGVECDIKNGRDEDEPIVLELVGAGFHKDPHGRPSGAASRSDATAPPEPSQTETGSSAGAAASRYGYAPNKALQGRIYVPPKRKKRTALTLVWWIIGLLFISGVAAGLYSLYTDFTTQTKEMIKNGSAINPARNITEFIHKQEELLGPGQTTEVIDIDSTQTGLFGQSLRVLASLAVTHFENTGEKTDDVSMLLDDYGRQVNVITRAQLTAHFASRAIFLKITAQGPEVFLYVNKSSLSNRGYWLVFHQSWDSEDTGWFEAMITEKPPVESPYHQSGNTTEPTAADKPDSSHYNNHDDLPGYKGLATEAPAPPDTGSLNYVNTEPQSHMRRDLSGTSSRGRPRVMEGMSEQARREYSKGAMERPAPHEEMPTNNPKQ